MLLTFTSSLQSFVKITSENTNEIDRMAKSSFAVVS